jgi:hypothetical protein
MFIAVDGAPLDNKFYVLEFRAKLGICKAHRSRGPAAQDKFPKVFCIGPRPASIGSALRRCLQIMTVSDSLAEEDLFFQADIADGRGATARPCCEHLNSGQSSAVPVALELQDPLHTLDSLDFPLVQDREHFCGSCSYMSPTATDGDCRRYWGK